MTDEDKRHLCERALFDADIALRGNDAAATVTARRSVRIALAALGWANIADNSPSELQEALNAVGLSTPAMQEQ